MLTRACPGWERTSANTMGKDGHYKDIDLWVSGKCYFVFVVLVCCCFLFFFGFFIFRVVGGGLLL